MFCGHQSMSATCILFVIFIRWVACHQEVVYYESGVSSRWEQGTGGSSDKSDWHPLFHPTDASRRQAAWEWGSRFPSPDFSLSNEKFWAACHQLQGQRSNRWQWHTVAISSSLCCFQPGTNDRAHPYTVVWTPIKQALCPWSCLKETLTQQVFLSEPQIMYKPHSKPISIERSFIMQGRKV